MAVRNVARGGGKAFKTEVTGLKELERKLKALAGSNPELRKAVQSAVGQMAIVARDEMRSQARSAGWGSSSITWKNKGKSGTVTGQQAINSIFAFGEPRENPGKWAKITALAGVGKRRTMFEWIAGRHPASTRARVAPGGKVAMSLAAALEFGTTRHAPKPAIRNAIANVKMRIIDTLTTEYNAILQRFTR